MDVSLLQAANGVQLEKSITAIDSSIKNKNRGT